MRRQLQFHAERRDFGRGVSIQISEELPNGGYAVVMPMTMEVTTTTTDEYIGPSLTLKQQEAQRLLDALIDAGLTPTREPAKVGEIEAVKYHLEDMRKLVFVERPAP